MKTNKSLNQEWYEQQEADAKKNYENAVSLANKEYSDIEAIIAQGYYNRATDLKNYRSAVEESNSKMEQAEFEHSVELNKLENQKNQKLLEARKKYNNDTSQYNAEASAIEQKYEDDVKKSNEEFEKKKTGINKNITDNFSENAQRQYGVWLQMLGDSEMYGAEIPKKDKKFVKESIKVLDELPPESRKIMNDAVDGMLKGFEDKEGTLYAKTSNIVDSIISIIRTGFNMHSPSRVMRKLFGFVWQGAEVATEDEGGNLIKQADNVVGDFINKLRNRLQKSNLVARVKSTIISEKSGIISSLTSNVIHSIANNSDEDNTKKAVIKGDIQTSINIDGREVGIALAPYVSEEMAFNNL